MLHRHVGSLLAFEDAVDVTSRFAILVEEIRTVRHQAAGGHKVALEVNGREL
jgi:hypothetical protein